MAAATTISGPSPSPIKRISQRRRAWNTFARNRSALVGLVLVVLIIAGLRCAPLIAPHDPLTQSTINRLKGPSGDYWLGRDTYGRDVFTATHSLRRG